MTVRLSRAATEALRIPISVDPRSGPFTLGGLGTDTTLTIASGISGTFTIRADQDADRVDETVTLGFGDLPSGVVAGTPSSATVTLTDGAPSAPTNVRVGPASSQGHQRLTVSWTAPPETVTGYQYRVGSGSLQSVPGTSATIGGLSPATSYQVQVRARNDYGISGWAAGSGSTECRAPSISGPASVSVPENTTAVARYSISDPDGGGGSWLSLAGADASSFNFSSGSLSFRSAPDYETDAQYQVTVRAQGGCSPSSSASRSVTVNILDVGPPGTPSLTLSVPSSGGHKNLDASWTVPSSGAGITGYQLQYCTSGARDDGESPANSGGQDPSARATCSTHSFGSDTTSTTLSGLKSSTLYTAVARATSSEGTGGWSLAMSAFTRANTAPVISGPASVSVAENTTSVAGYTVSDADGDGVSWLSLAGADTSSFNFSSGSLSFRSAPDYESGTTQYRVTVKAADDAPSTRSASRAVTVNVTDVGPPGTPRLTLSVPSSGGHKNLDASWTVPSSGAGITGYQLQYCTSGARDDGESPANSGGQDQSARATCSTHSFGSDTTSTTLSGLKSSTLYTAVARATSSEGTGGWSVGVSAFTRANTAPVISGTARQNVNENTTAVGTYTATDAEGDGITWDIYSTDSDEFSFTSSGSSLTLRFESAPDYENPTDANTNNIYVVRIRATDDGNPPANSNKLINAIVQDIGPPSKMTVPTVRVPSSGTGTLEVSWSHPTSGAPVTGYTLQYCYAAFRSEEDPPEEEKDDSDAPRQAICSETTLGRVTSKTLTGLHGNILYLVRMKATSKEGTGPWSNSGSGITRSAAAKALAEQLALTGLEGLAALAAPNPFNPSTTIYFQVPEAGEVSLVVYSLAGQVVRKLIPGRTLKAGIYDVFWEGRDEQGRPVAAGVYFYRLRAGDRALVRKMTLLR